MKDRARVMIKMATAINTEYLTQLTDPKAEQHGDMRNLPSGHAPTDALHAQAT